MARPIDRTALCAYNVVVTQVLPTRSSVMRRRETSDPELCQVTCIHPPDVARARAGLVADATYRDLADLFGALADPTRARIVHALLRQELCSCDIAAVAGVSASGASQHLRVLRNLRLVKARRVGKLVYYT